MKKVHVGLLLVLVLIGALTLLDMYGVFPTLEMIREDRMMIESYLMKNLLSGVVLFALLYILTVTFSLPIATPLTLLAGFLFGVPLGVSVVVVSATIGAVLVFLLVRYFFNEAFTEKLGTKVDAINGELTDHGIRSILLLRLAPIFPFFVINAGAGLTKVKLRDYTLATLIGIAPFSFVLVLAGKRLGEIMSVGDVISFETILVVSVVALSFFLPGVIRRQKTKRLKTLQ